MYVDKQRKEALGVPQIKSHLKIIADLHYKLMSSGNKSEAICVIECF